MVIAMRRLAVAVVVLAGSMFLAGYARAEFKLEVNNVQVASTFSGHIDYMGGSGGVGYRVIGDSVATSASSHLIQTFTMSFDNITESPVVYTFKLTETAVLSSLSGPVNGTFSGDGFFSSSTREIANGTTNLVATIEGAASSALTQTIFNDPNFAYGKNNKIEGNFATGYAGNAPLSMSTTLTVTVPAMHSFTFSGGATYSVPEPATIAMLASGVPLLGAIGWMRRKRKAPVATA